jgi:hypothetical protein
MDKPYELFIKNIKYKTIYVIDSYRDGLERNISTFFQSSCFCLKPIETIDVNILIYWFNKFFLYCDDYEPLDSEDQYPVFNDILNFDFDKKYLIKKVDNVNYIKI